MGSADTPLIPAGLVLDVASQSPVDGVDTLYQGYGTPLARPPIPDSLHLARGLGAVWAVAVGAEAARRIPVRLELRTVFVDSHPLLHGAHQIELQARLTVLFSGR